MPETTVENTSEEIREEVQEAVQEEIQEKAPEKSQEKAQGKKKEKTKKKSWFKSLKAEFKKIVWPDKKTLIKETVAVITCSLILGAIIAVVDALVQFGIDLFVR